MSRGGPQTRRSAISRIRARGKVTDLMGKPGEPDSVAEVFPEDLQGIVRALRNIDDPGYLLAIKYLKRHMTVREVLEASEDGDPIRTFLNELGAFKSKHPEWGDPSEDPLAQNLLRLSRTECPGKGINVLNPHRQPDRPSAYDASQELTIHFGVDQDASVRVVPDHAHHCSRLSAGKDTAVLRDGESIVLGRMDLTLRKVLGIELKSIRSLGVGLRVDDQFVSRASVLVRRSADGKSLTILDCGSINPVTVTQGDDRTEYNPASMVSVSGPRRDITSS